MICPAGGHKIAHPDGECATARGAGMSNTLMMLSTSSHYSMEDVAKAASGPLWFQLYHREITQMLVRAPRSRLQGRRPDRGYAVASAERTRCPQSL